MATKRVRRVKPPTKIDVSYQKLNVIVGKCEELGYYEADLHQILGKLFVRKAFRNLDMVLEPINVNHWHGSITPPSQTVR